MSPFNADNTRLLLVHQSYFGLYDGQGSFISALPMEINSSSEPRWSRTNASVFDYVRDNQLKQYNVATGAVSVVHTFSGYTQHQRERRIGHLLRRKPHGVRRLPPR